MPVPTFTANCTKSTPTAPQGPAGGADHTTGLAQLLPLWPHELNDMTPSGRERRIALLRKALRAERRRGLAGHWTYDLGRHSALLHCYKREVELAQAAGLTTAPKVLQAKAG